MTTEYVKKTIEEIKAKLIAAKRPFLADSFEKCYPNTLETTTELNPDGTAFVFTGDIPAMWLRDSSAQVRHYLPLAKKDEKIRRVIEGLIAKQAECILNDAYANAFNREASGKCWSADKTEFTNPLAWERKYEIDSLCYPVCLAYLYMKASGSKAHITENFRAACKRILEVFETEQHHENSKYFFIRENCPPSDTLPENGKGNPVAYTGMTWSGFRPSDDACRYGYLIPSNMFAVVILGYMEEMFCDDNGISSRANTLKKQIDEGIKKYGIYDHPIYGKIYAYETDGMGNYTLMDDANVPSLLSIPYLGYVSADDEIYKNTRKFILSKENPYYYEGKAAKGIGSPHTPERYIWHISLSMQGLTSQNNEEKEYLLDLFERSTAGTGYMHEGFDVDDPDRFTRAWFAWANSIFSEFILSVFGE
jgi:meiotically up-regulated gene 157 (Mug157) protein